MWYSLNFNVIYILGSTLLETNISLPQNTVFESDDFPAFRFGGIGFLVPLEGMVVQSHRSIHPLA